MTKKKFMRILPKKVIQIGTADPRTREQTEKKEEARQGVRKEEEEQTQEEYEVVEREILPQRIICPDCGGVTLEGLEFCHKCGGEINGT